LYSNGHSFEDWQTFKEFVLTEEDFLKGLIAKETVATLKKYTYRADNKKQAVDSVFSTIAQCAVMGDSFSYSPFDETWQQALKRITNSYTAETYAAYKAKLQAKREEREKALNNPETLEEFRSFIASKGEAALTSEQRIKYDELTADLRRAIKEREEKQKAQVASVENVSAEMHIKESFHAKKQIPLWVVVLDTRVQRSVYEELNNRAKKLGGYYSSFKGNGAIPGFTFENKEAAELFAQVKNGNVDASELKQQSAEQKQQTRAEALKEKGINLIKDGERELNRDRETNTHRRAAMAENAERKAAAQISFGKTLVKIGEAMETEEIKYLYKISNSRDLEELKSILSMAKNRHINALNLDRSKYQTSLETVNFAELPYPILYANRKGEIERMKDVPGKKLAASRMLKRLAPYEYILINSQQRVEDYETLFCQRCSVVDSWQIDRYKEQLMHMKRLQRIGIDTIEELRAALRELLNLEKGTGLSEEQKRSLQIKELERKFIGSKIPGFFPTPETLAAQIVELANIQPGDTILEPSAGLGHIADQIKADHPGNELLCVEINHSLFEALKAKGHLVQNGDFLNMLNDTESLKFDKIIMNPPFENLQDVEHVKHAFQLLNGGGRLVAIMANNKHRSPEFLQMVERYGTIEENPAGSFASVFRPTGVSTVTVILDKP